MGGDGERARPDAAARPGDRILGATLATLIALFERLPVDVGVELGAHF